MNIEKYNKHSVKEIIKIDNEAVEDFYELITEVYSQKDLLDIENYYKDGAFYVAVMDGAVIGTCGYLIADEKTVELKRLRISKQHRDKGCGSILLRYVEKEIRDRGFERIILNTSSLREGTLAFYKKHNYIVTGEEDFGKLKLIDYEKYLERQEVS